MIPRFSESADSNRSRFFNIYCANHADQEVSPDILFSLYEFNQDKFPSDIFKHDFSTMDIIARIDYNLFSTKYYGEEKEQIIKYKNRFLKALSTWVQKKDNGHFSKTIENFFSFFSDRIEKNKIFFRNIISTISQQIWNDLKEMPINPSNFPHYIASNPINDEILLIELFEQKEKKINSNQADDQTNIYSFSELFQIYQILSKYPKIYTFSPNFVISSLIKLDKFILKLSQAEKNNYPDIFSILRNLDHKSEEYKCFKIFLLIRLQLLMQINKIFDFLNTLIQLIIIDQETPQIDVDDHLSFKNIINEILPNCSTRRSIILSKVSNDQIYDFSFSNDEQNDYILTKEGVFKINQNPNRLIEFNLSNFTQINFNDEINKENSKLAFSNGILYLLSAKDKKIHKVVVSKNEEVEIKKAKIQQKLDKIIEHSTKNHPKKKETKENKNAKSKLKSKENKMTKKKIKEKEKKDRRQKRKLEKLEFDKDIEIDLETVQIDIDDLPILSFGVFNDYARIIQRKICNENKINLIFTNIDLSPNNRVNFNFDDAFNTIKIDQKSIQTRIEIEINEKCNFNNVFLSKNSLYLTLNEFCFQHFLIIDDGRVESTKKIDSPFVINPNSVIKMDNKSFLYNFVPIKNDEDNGISVTQMHLTETKHFLREENDLFLKYPYLHKLSNIVDNCTQFILNRNAFTTITYSYIKDKMTHNRYNRNKKPTKKVKDPLYLTVSPNEMGILSCLGNIKNYKPMEVVKNLIKEFKDEKLKTFFISLFMKIVGINFIYINKNLNIESELLTSLTNFKSFIFDLYSLKTPSNSIDSEIVIKESMSFLLFTSGKYLFLPGLSYNELRSFVNKTLFNDENSKPIIKSLSNFMFSQISSLYIIDDDFYEKLLEMENEIDICDLFKKNIFYILIESSFSINTYKDLSFIDQISPYIDVVFKYFQHLINDKSTRFTIIKEFLSYILSLNQNNVCLSLILERKFIEISPVLFQKIKEIPGVLENDNEFLEKNQNIENQEFESEVKEIESVHPYNPDPVPIPYKKPPKRPKKDSIFDNRNNKPFKKPKQYKQYKQFYYEDVGTIEFDESIDKISVRIDQRSKFNEFDEVYIFSKNEKHIINQCDSMYSEDITISDNKIRVVIGRNIEHSQTVEKKYWGIKLIVTGIKLKNNVYWKPNHYLILYSYFISTLMDNFTNANNSLSVYKIEDEFKYILDNNIIQGIKLEDIDNYEANINNEQENTSNAKRGISRGISRGITSDSLDESIFDVKMKKDFLNDIINIDKDNKTTPAKRFIDFLYIKTAKQNRIKLNESSKNILEAEHYFAACLIKQLDLISTCINFLQILNVTKSSEYKNIEAPNHLYSLWKNIYSLRKILFFEYQKSKADPNAEKSNYKKMLNEVKQKCKLLLYSDSILSFKDKDDLNNDTINSAAKSIFSFVKSEIPLSNISKLIDIRRKRLSISEQSITLMIKFLDQNLLFESSKLIFACNNKALYPINNFLGVKQNEIEKYKNIMASLSVKMTQNVFNQQSISMMTNQHFILKSILHQSKCDSIIQMSKILINMIDKNKENKSLFKNKIDFVLLHLLIIIAFKTEDKELINYIISLLNDEFDVISKQLILFCIPAFIQFIPNSIDEIDSIKEQSAFSILSKSKDNPYIIKSILLWIAELYINESDQESIEHQNFILKIFEIIGRGFLSKNCLLLDDSYKPNAHFFISLSCCSFIKVLFNSNNVDILTVIHDILSNKINEINFNDLCIEKMYAPIGLFISLEHAFTKSAPRKLCTLSPDGNRYLNIKDNHYYQNFIPIENAKLELNEKEIDNILHLHEIILKSKYFNDNQQQSSSYDEGIISDKEITENMLFSTFYSFLPMIMQIKHNANLLLNESNMQRTLSLFDLAMKTVPSNLYSIDELVKALMESITKKSFYSDFNFDFNKNYSFRFLKMNFGEIIYDNEKGNDLIKSDKNHFNIFMCNMPIYFKIELYFEVKINKIGLKNIFIGFIDSEEIEYDKAFGFGNIGHSDIFCRRSPLLAKSFFLTEDELMKSEQITKELYNDFLVKEGDTIGCYYTNDFTYLTINGQLTKYRLSNKSLNNYFPVIMIDTDEIELEIVKNITIVDKEKKNEFDFLDIKKVPNGFFEEKDIISSNQSDNYNQPVLRSKNKKSFVPIIGKKIRLNLFLYGGIHCESIENIPNNFFDFINEYGYIKEVIPSKNDPFVFKYVIEFSNSKILKMKEIEIDSRFCSPIKSTFYQIIMNITHTKFGYNNAYSLIHLPQKLREKSDYCAIRKYMKNKTIKTNSVSISILMTRYLVFILVDYLRYSKSKLLQDEGINSKEMQTIIKSLAHSLLNITKFIPSFDYKIDFNDIKNFIIFPDEVDEIEYQNEKDDVYNNDILKKFVYKTPGDCNMFTFAFKMFLKKSEDFISPHFLPNLLKEIYEITKDNSLSLQNIYEVIDDDLIMESITPMPKEFSYKIENNLHVVYSNVVGFIPILVNSIPDQLPSVTTFNKKLRVSSDQISYFNFNTNISGLLSEWKYKLENVPSEIKNFKLKFGLFFLVVELQKKVLDGPLGFIQIVFILMQSLIDSDSFYKKQKEILCHDILDYVFDLSLKKNPIVYPFLEPIIISIIAINGFSDYLLTQKVCNSFSSMLRINDKNLIYPMKSFPTSNNEFHLIFSLYSILIKSRNSEISDKISPLFEKYSIINNELFKSFENESKPKFSEGVVKEIRRHIFSFEFKPEIKKKKNYSLIYLLYYYSILLCNDDNLPYPMFLFVNDWIRQRLGGFRIVITKSDIKNFENNEIHYKSIVFDNENDLDCSCNLINIFEKDKNKKDKSARMFSFNHFSNAFRINYYHGSHRPLLNDDVDIDKKEEEVKNDNKNAYKIVVHQLKNNEKIEIPLNGEKVKVSFPLEILVYKNDGNMNELINGDAFVINFAAPNETQQKCFEDHFEEIQEDFKQFISLVKYDNELSKIYLTTKGASNDHNASNNNNNNNNDNNNNNNNDNNNNNNNDNNNNNNDNNNNNNNIDNNNDDGDAHIFDFQNLENKQENRDDFKLYEIKKIPKKIDFDFPSSLDIKPNVIALRYSILITYSNLFELIMVSYNESTQSTYWNFPLTNNEKYKNIYSKQIIRPARSMSTELKFKFISQIFMNEAKENPQIHIVLNRFESQKFIENLNKKSNVLARPLFLQFVEQIDEDSLSLLKVQGRVPFDVELVGENAIDAGGPGREIFSSLIMELMNENIGIFTFNPNRNHGAKDTNQEDLIPNKISKGNVYFDFYFDDHLILFVYAGALIAACIVSDLPQTMKLASFIWEYLSHGTVSIDSIYEIDSSFKELIETAERILERIKNSPSMDDDEFESLFLRNFNINDSFNNVVELIPSGSKKRVTKENLDEFIELAKNFRIHEFDKELNELKRGFDQVMCYSNITSILLPNELKLLACGESNCSVEQMKKLFVINVENPLNDTEYTEKMTRMFWNVMESFSVEERMLFIRFSSGNLGLPAPGLRWEKDLSVNIKQKDNPIKMAIAHTCFSSVEIPFFESEEQLSKVLKISINFSGLITDSHMNPEQVAEFL